MNKNIINHIPNYIYNIGDVVNNSIILEQLYIKENNGNDYRRKHYKCKCLKDGYEYIFKESELKRGKKCPRCICFATTDPNVVKFLLDKEDGYKYTRGSNKHIWVVCPFCGHKKLIKIECPCL